MSFTTIIALGLALIVGAAVGYYLRLIVSLGKKGSMELEIKQMILGAKEEAQRVLDDAKKKAEEKTEELKEEEKKRLEEAKQTEHRLIKKEELLDARQVEIDKEVENMKLKIEEVRTIKEKVDGMLEERQKLLEGVAKLSTDEAKDALMKEVELQCEEDSARAHTQTRRNRPRNTWIEKQKIFLQRRFNVFRLQLHLRS
jgi:ribonuclease Y